MGQLKVRGGSRDKGYKDVHFCPLEGAGRSKSVAYLGLLHTLSSHIEPTIATPKMVPTGAVLY